MGGGGTYYDRDVTDKSTRLSGGFSLKAQRELSQSSVNKELLPKDRTLVCETANPLVYVFDVTGSMGSLPKIIYDKWPGIVGQIVARQYLPDPQMSLCALGDVTSDEAPLQMADFAELRNLDRYFKKIFFEGRGGGQHFESYEMAAYFYAYQCKIDKAQNPICLFTGDEGFREQLFARDLKEHFGGNHQNVTASTVFADLVKKFKGNVFLVHRTYPDASLDAEIVAQWRKVLGNQRVILLPNDDLAIGDVTLGVYAIVSGAKTLEQYLKDMRTRPLDLGSGVAYEPQAEGRVKDVAKALAPLKSFQPVMSAPKPSSKGKKKANAKPAPESDGDKDENWKL